MVIFWWLSNFIETISRNRKFCAIRYIAITVDHHCQADFVTGSVTVFLVITHMKKFVLIIEILSSY